MHHITETVDHNPSPGRTLTEGDRDVLAAAQAAARLRAGLEISLRDAARLTRLHMLQTMGGSI